MFKPRATHALLLLSTLPPRLNVPGASVPQQLLALFQELVFSVVIWSPIALNQTLASHSRTVRIVRPPLPTAHGVKARRQYLVSVMGTEPNALEPSDLLHALTPARASLTLIALPALLISAVAPSATESLLLLALSNAPVPLVRLARLLLLLKLRPNSLELLRLNNLLASQLILQSLVFQPMLLEQPLPLPPLLLAARRLPRQLVVRRLPLRQTLLLPLPLMAVLRLPHFLLLLRKLH